MGVLRDLRQHRKAVCLCMVATLGAIAFGYDGSYFSSILVMPPFIRAYGVYDKATDTYSIPSWLLSLITSIINLGEFLGAIASHKLGVMFGRRGGLIVGCVTILLGVLIHSVAPKIALLVIGRLLLGMGVAFMAAFVPLYIGDCAPSTLRGALAGAFQLSIGIGLIIGTAVDYGTRNRTDSSSYLIPMTVQAILPLFLMIACFIWLPESPRWLAEKGKVEKARRSLSRLAGSSNSDQVENDLLMITASIDQAHENTNGSWKELIIPGPESRKLMISIGMAAWNQASGINFVVSYGAVIINSIGTVNPYVANLALYCAALPVIMTCQYLFERVGRRKCVMASMVGIGLIDIVDGGIGLGPKTTNFNNAAVAMFFLFYLVFNLGIGGGTWVSLAEINTGSNRSRLMSISTASVWIFAWLVSFTFPYLYNPDSANLGPKIGFIYGSLMLVGTVWVYFFLPETAGRSLEEIDEMFRLGIPARKFASFVCPSHPVTEDMKLSTEGKGSQVDTIEVSDA